MEFHFLLFDDGNVFLSWASNHKIQGMARPPNPFEVTSANERRKYRIVDDVSPSVVEVIPTPGDTVRTLNRLRIFFGEAVTGFDNSDIRINGNTPNLRSR